ncbi:AAA family ATPase [Methylocapsa sp. D3K7]|uniref:AAA family ATPase n=1 Tax=Methylocapsa sp. D3K7 TaxID=3041435 RepID=UPI00244EF15B|nr:AAA family ATPase [Methylocapsa sp. D3K7]WGJ14271.1 AAA family ATPase [Methylocapsa sp. D3K7]
MRIKSISTKNYRTLQDLTINFSNGYCTISGRNNAGKSCLIRLLSKLFEEESSLPWAINQGGFEYKLEKTQWLKDKFPINITYTLELTKPEDPALISFIEKIATITIPNEIVALVISYSITESDTVDVTMSVDQNKIDEQATKEIDKKLKDSNIMFLYNSTTSHEALYYGHSRTRLFYDFMMSADEKRALSNAQKTIQQKMRRLAKDHTRRLSNILGRLAEKYDVEASTPEGLAMGRMPISINLKDQNVDVPLSVRPGSS